ncbi:SDR family NAD(P)-dependent oxidoreductase [Cellulomonas sp. HZM]|uniref:SDR family NAD(P)-dependent oxidoreductase n=1 Tax=Cellulomonas sp. HZM TaxID=1454010 RepID=UPI00049352DA|nr:SDR family NAD(P)-dependent oxidoreductase [Cellulomonas sp. HZM]
MSAVLVTGTSSGIGLSTAIAAARQGWDVVATVRSHDRAAALLEGARSAGVTLDVRELDVTRADDVTALVDAVAKDHDGLEALVNNAGAGRVGTAEMLSLEDVREVMEVNFFSVVAATQAALPHLRASGGRVVTVTSVGGVVGQPFNDAYCAAKFAAEGFLESLHPVAATAGVAVVVVEPGAVATHFATGAVADEDALRDEAGAYGSALDAYLARTAGVFAAAQHPDAVAEVVVDVLRRDEPPFRVQTSDVARVFAGLKLADLDGSRVTGATAAWLV